MLTEKTVSECVFADGSKGTHEVSPNLQIWRNADGQLHNDGDRPAMILVGSTNNDKLPILIRLGWVYGNCSWYTNGKLDRKNGLPAYVCADGNCEWYEDDKMLHQKNCSKHEIKKYKKPCINKALGVLRRWWLLG